MESIESHVQELQHFLTQAKHPQTQKLLQDGILNAQSSIEFKTEKSLKSSTQTQEVVVSKVLTKVSSYGWDETTKVVKIYLSDIPSIDQAKEENINLNCTRDSVEVIIEKVNNRNYQFEIKNLAGGIKPTSSKAILKRGSVVITLVKEIENKWEYLTQSEKKTKEAKKDTPKMDKEEDPGAGIMSMMKKMYDDGDDEMKRTIEKAWYESRNKMET